MTPLPAPPGTVATEPELLKKIHVLDFFFEYAYNSNLVHKTHPGEQRPSKSELEYAEKTKTRGRDACL